jgi:hypothetical protein
MCTSCFPSRSDGVPGLTCGVVLPPQAIECRTEKELLQKVALGLKVAVTNGARARLVSEGGR